MFIFSLSNWTSRYEGTTIVVEVDISGEWYIDAEAIGGSSESTRLVANRSIELAFL